MIGVRAIRFGGQDGADGFLFELGGGALPLDFANTLDERPRGGRERLTDYRELVRWGEQSGVLTEQQASRLQVAALENPRAADQVYTDAVELRELVFTTIKAAIGADALTESQAGQWNGWLNRVRADRCLAPGPQGLAWRVADHGARLDGILNAVAQAAIALFIDPTARSRLRLCRASTCDWAFLDTTRRQNRVWCDMTVCGNRAKATRHYRRKTGG